MWAWASLLVVFVPVTCGNLDAGHWDCEDRSGAHPSDSGDSHSSFRSWSNPCPLHHHASEGFSCTNVKSRLVTPAALTRSRWTRNADCGGTFRQTRTTHAACCMPPDLPHFGSPLSGLQLAIPIGIDFGLLKRKRRHSALGTGWRACPLRDRSGLVGGKHRDGVDRSSGLERTMLPNQGGMNGFRRQGTVSHEASTPLGTTELSR